MSVIHPLRRPISAVFVMISVSLLSACSLIARPEPLTTLQLIITDGDAMPQWPAALAAGNVVGTSTLLGNRVLVVNGALLMQHEGMRWVDTPALMISEQIHTLHAQTAGNTAPVAAINLRLSAFNLRIGSGGEKHAVVAASGNLRCLGSERARALAPVSAKATPANASAQALADAFARASGEVLAGLLGQVSDLNDTCSSTH